MSPLGRECPIQPPPGAATTPQRFTLKCVMPDRARTQLKMSYRDHTGHVTDQVDGIELDGFSARGATLKLYTNGEFVVNTLTRTHRARVTRWPRLRGLGHDYQHEIELTIPPKKTEFKMNTPRITGGCRADRVRAEPALRLRRRAHY